MRRVVTGHTSDGKAILVSDNEVDALVPGMEFYEIWGADEAPTFPDNGLPYPHTSYFPPLGGFRFDTFTVPPESTPESETVNYQAALAAMEEKLPDLVSCMEKGNPGMHTTDTIDFEYVISGEVWLELDDGKEVHLQAGDMLIQNGTRHAWRNHSSEPCRMVVCMIGAHRK